MCFSHRLTKQYVWHISMRHNILMQLESGRSEFECIFFTSSEALDTLLMLCYFLFFLSTNCWQKPLQHILIVKINTPYNCSILFCYLKTHILVNTVKLHLCFCIQHWFVAIIKSQSTAVESMITWCWAPQNVRAQTNYNQINVNIMSIWTGDTKVLFRISPQYNK